MTNLATLAQRISAHRSFPLALAMAGIVLMLPALSTGLLGDDLIQRLNQLRPDELPPHASETGFVANDSGKLSTVMWNLFGYVRGEAAAVRARDYGIAPWWAPEDWTAALMRPLTAFTHWFDYRVFPNAPELMHAHNILWFAAAVFLAATLYRKIAINAQSGLNHDITEPSAQRARLSGLSASGLAACLWLLDKNTYVPVMYVANRGFIISLVFGLLCLHAHRRWRTTRSNAWMWLSGLWLLFSLLANEGGASTLAFLLAYAVVLDRGGWRSRLMSLLPAACVVVGWRAVYVACGYGVKHFQGYIDPGYSPLLFLKNVVPRSSALLGGQLTGVPPELLLGLNGEWAAVFALLFAGFSLVCAVAFLPILRRDAAAQFWGLVMLLALVPAATVAPLSKNFGFVAIGAFGLIASFLLNFAEPRERAALSRPARALSWCVAVWLLVAHIPGAVAARVILALASPSIPRLAARACAFPYTPQLGERDVVVINDPTIIAAVVPFDRAYRGQPLPRTVHILIPGSVPFTVSRPDAFTLVLKAKELDLFDCPAAGPIHAGYALKAANDLLFGGKRWKATDRVTRKGFVTEILEVSDRGLPRSLAFHFDSPLESESRVWLFFDWRHRAHSPFVLPRIGETVDVAGVSGN